MAIEQKTGTAATLAIIAAIGGIVLVFLGNPGWACLWNSLPVYSGPWDCSWLHPRA
jgi:hypothetical protein